MRNAEWNAECECGMRNECGVRNAECGMECGMRMRNAESGRSQRCCSVRLGRDSDAKYTEWEISACGSRHADRRRRARVVRALDRCRALSRRAAAGMGARRTGER